MTSDPLVELLAHLERDGTVPLAWVTEHAPDGDLRRAWNASRAAAEILWLHVVGQLGDPRGLVGAAVACARTVLTLAGRDRGTAEHALDLAARWAGGGAAADDEWAAARMTVERAEREARGAGESARRCALGAAGCALGAVGVQWAHDAFDQARRAPDAVTAAAMARAFAGAAVTEQAYATDPGWRRAYDAALADYAVVVRDNVPCPTLEQLIAAYRAR